MSSESPQDSLTSQPTTSPPQLPQAPRRPSLKFSHPAEYVWPYELLQRLKAQIHPEQSCSEY